MIILVPCPIQQRPWQAGLVLCLKLTSCITVSGNEPEINQLDHVRSLSPKKHESDYAPRKSEHKISTCMLKHLAIGTQVELLLNLTRCLEVTTSIIVHPLVDKIGQRRSSSIHLPCSLFE
jgi:hypothetical protein